MAKMHQTFECDPRGNNLGVEIKLLEGKYGHPASLTPGFSVVNKVKGDILWASEKPEILQSFT